MKKSFFKSKGWRKIEVIILSLLILLFLYQIGRDVYLVFIKQ